MEDELGDDVFIMLTFTNEYQKTPVTGKIDRIIRK
tara:strand:- start:397 stop:501 length:105 start_codon:yes stop_codon:yes gene_type:complete